MSTVRALTSFATATRAIHAGQEVDAADPVAVQFPSLFSPDGIVHFDEPETVDAPAKKAPARKAAPARKTKG